MTIRLLISLVLAALPVSASGPETLDVEVTPQEVGIGVFFSGRTVTVSGSAGSSLDVAVEVFGPAEEGRFHLKGRAGPLWMNLKEVHLGNAPLLYLLLTSDGVVSEEDLTTMGIGLKHIENSVEVRPESLDKDMIFDQYLQLKRSQGLYAERQGAVSYGSPDGERRSFRAEFLLPSSATPGTYEIVATGLDGNLSVCNTLLEFQVVEVGVIKAIRDFAFSYGLMYGIVCVVIALLVGGVMGMFFKRAGAH